MLGCTRSAASTVAGDFVRAAGGAARTTSSDSSSIRAVSAAERSSTSRKTTTARCVGESASSARRNANVALSTIFVVCRGRHRAFVDLDGRRKPWTVVRHLACGGVEALINREPHRHLHDPRLERLLGRHRWHRFESTRESLLKHLVGVGRAARDAIARRPDLLAVDARDVLSNAHAAARSLSSSMRLATVSALSATASSKMWLVLAQSPAK